MGFYSAWLFPRVLDLVMRQKQLIPLREQIAKTANGRVLDVGIGSGLNLAFYGGQTECVYGIDPSDELLQFARQRARDAAIPIELFRVSAEALPFSDKSLDTAVTTFTLCSVDSPAASLAEIRRVLKPNGKLLFAEHGRAPEPQVARWQDRLTPIWSRLAGGCHLNRKPDDLIQSAGFQIDGLETRYLKGPRAMTFVYSGYAHAV